MERNKKNTRTFTKYLINHYESRAAVAVALECSENYVYAMEAGRQIPGKHLFKRIIEHVEGLE